MAHSQPGRVIVRERRMKARLYYIIAKPFTTISDLFEQWEGDENRQKNRIEEIKAPILLRWKHKPYHFHRCRVVKPVWISKQQCNKMGPMVSLFCWQSTDLFFFFFCTINNITLCCSKHVPLTHFFLYYFFFEKKKLLNKS